MSTVNWSHGNYELFRGNDLRVLCDAVNQAGKAVNISGATIRMAISARPGTVPLLQKQTGDGITLSNNTRFFFDITRSESAALPMGNLHIEVEVVNPDGRSYTVFSANLLIKPATLLP